MMDIQVPLALADEHVGVTEYARHLLVNDARNATIRTYVLIGGNGKAEVTNTFLAVWGDYDRSDEWRELRVIHDGGNHLVHRKHNPHAGFTPFAKETLLYPTGHAKDTKRRVYVMGGKDADGKRLRREMSATILVAWLDYAALSDYTHLWVKWKDGKRHLVHRKGL